MIMGQLHSLKMAMLTGTYRHKKRCWPPTPKIASLDEKQKLPV